MYEFQSEWNTFITKTSANKWRADVDWLTKCDSIYHRKMLKTLKNKNTIRRKYLSHFQSTARQRLRRAAVSWTVIEPQQNHPKSSFMKDSSSVHWFLAFIIYETWNVMYEFVRWKLCYLPNYLFFQIEKTDYLRIFIPSLTYL